MLAAALLGMIAAAVLRLIDGRHAVTLGIGLVAIGTVSWIDDRYAVRVSVRLAVHTAVAAWTLFMFDGLPAVQLGSSAVELGAAGYVLGVLGIVWSINLFNFMDGIDGLAASQAILYFGAGALLLFLRGDSSLGAIAALLGTAVAGFLVWNWPPAKIFLGDVGSAAIGYAAAGLAIASENSGKVPLLAFTIIGGVLISDATITLLRRVARGDQPAEAHRDHAYQRLARAWNSHRWVTERAAALTVLLTVLAVIGTLTPGLLIPAAFATCLILGSVLIAVERRAPM